VQLPRRCTVAVTNDKLSRAPKTSRNLDSKAVHLLERSEVGIGRSRYKHYLGESGAMSAT